MKKIYCCQDYETWNGFESGVYTFAYSHGIKYPDDYPKFKICPFCAAKAFIPEEKENRENKP